MTIDRYMTHNEHFAHVLQMMYVWQFQITAKSSSQILLLSELNLVQTNERGISTFSIDVKNKYGHLLI